MTGEADWKGKKKKGSLRMLCMRNRFFTKKKKKRKRGEEKEKKGTLFGSRWEKKRKGILACEDGI